MHRYEALDAWRGVAALLVAVYHLPVAHGLALQPWFKAIELFVDFFFVLSGFVICHAYSERLENGPQATRFLIRRFGRVWPLHAVVLGLLVALELGRLAAATLLGTAFSVPPFTETRTVDAIVTNLFLVQAFDLHP
jgi:peptidoglycan/LPS O-acetylase OafA/YrhL